MKVYNQRIGQSEAGKVNTPTKTKSISPDKTTHLDKSSEVTKQEDSKVSISNKAKESAQAKQIAKSASDVDEEKIQRLRAAIQNGTYKVNAEQIANRLVDEHLSF